MSGLFNWGFPVTGWAGARTAFIVWPLVGLAWCLLEAVGEGLSDTQVRLPLPGRPRVRVGTIFIFLALAITVLAAAGVIGDVL